MIYEDILKNPDQYSFAVQSLGSCTEVSPLRGRRFVDAQDQITFASQVKNICSLQQHAKVFPAFQKAGPRARIFHRPATTRAGIVTCGGLCPGLNNVIKGLVTVLFHDYYVTTIKGFRYGYQGLVAKYGHAPIDLTPALVDEIHKSGGTILGSSRGSQAAGAMVDTLDTMQINLLFCIGGDGTLRGA
jgi:6-phosphofructokinase 1